MVVSGTVIKKGSGMPVEYSTFDLIPHLQGLLSAAVGSILGGSFCIRSTMALIC